LRFSLLDGPIHKGQTPIVVLFAVVAHAKMEIRKHNHVAEINTAEICHSTPLEKRTGSMFEVIVTDCYLQLDNLV
jgi:hypothetical protein